MKTAEIRSKFLEYFKKNGHTVVPSAPLVPQNDPTLLFTNAGMVPFKDVFTGRETRDYTRACSAQKCVRAGGKHNDLENVGFTARHHTFFEMLGNFSFGDYFKKDAIRYAWDFITNELKLPKDKLYVTVFHDDDEAAGIWEKQESVPRERIYRFGEKDNFWAMGDTGPCGPCSEIFFDRGEKYGCGGPDCAVGCECDRYMEIWNLVFMQFDRDAGGKMTPLPKPSIDTGAGLERLASVLQQVDSNYEIDSIHDIIRRTEKLTPKNYKVGDELAPSFRVIADHARATAFLIGDGVLPSNEGRGYVLRRIIRRAVRHGTKLDIEEPFLHQVCGFVVDQMSESYPALREQAEFIKKATLAEEEQFFKTLDRGLTLLDEETAKLSGKKALPGEVAFKLYDTYGFPLDLTRVILAERGLSVDEEGFEKAMERQRSESRKHWKGSGEEAVNEVYQKVAERLRKEDRMPEFVGYEHLYDEAECVALLAAEGDEGLREIDFYTTGVDQAAGPDARGSIVQAVFARTPFYGESGGQVGDHGTVSGDGFEAEVVDVQKPVGDLIVAHLLPRRGTIKTGGKYHQSTDDENRALTARNHTATHLLHWALREVLGAHVKQAGSLVAPDLLRFDFTHFQAMTPEELRKVEDLINEKIWSGDVVQKRVMAKDDAVAAGAIAFFGEKYGDEVRVVSVGDYSVELCGGTHVDRSSDIHLFKLGSESGIAAGVRRIIAYTSKGAFDFLRARDGQLLAVRDRLKASSVDEVDGKLERLIASEKDLRKTIEKLQARQAGAEVENMLGSAKDLPGGAKLVTGRCEPNAQGVKRLREISDRIKQKIPSAITVLGIEDPEKGKTFLLVAVGPEAPKSVKAGDVIRQIAPAIDGRGGGKPEMAQAGGSKPEGIPEALTQAESFITGKLQG